LGVLAAPAAVTTLTGTAIVSTAGLGEVAGSGAVAGVVGGLAERAVEHNGDMNKATENPTDVLVDAGLGAAGALTAHVASGLLPKATGAEASAHKAAQAAAKHPPLSKSALARQTARAAGAAAAKSASQETAGHLAGHAAAEAAGQAVKQERKEEK